MTPLGDEADSRLFRTVVLALDGSAESEACLPVAVKCARQSDAEMVIVHIEQILTAKGSVPVLADEERIEKRLRELAGELTEAGVPATLRSSVATTRNPAHEIEEIARELDADLIIVGTRGNGPMKTLMVGSVTSRLLQIAERPILAVAPGARRRAAARWN